VAFSVIVKVSVNVFGDTIASLFLVQ
jgi:hypothetical protein